MFLMVLVIVLLLIIFIVSYLLWKNINYVVIEFYFEFELIIYFNKNLLDNEVNIVV